MKISAKAGTQILEVEVRRENGSYLVVVDGVRHDVDAHKLEGDFYSILTGGRSYEVSVEVADGAYHVRHGAAELTVSLSDPGRQARDAREVADGPEEIRTMMPGKVVRLLVAEGDEVQEGQGVVVVEAMKMENEITAGKTGRVSRIHVKTQQTVESGAVLLIVE